MMEQLVVIIGLVIVVPPLVNTTINFFMDGDMIPAAFGVASCVGCAYLAEYLL